MLKNPKSNNPQHVPKIVELDDFDTEKMKVAEIQPLKCLKKTLLSLEASKKNNKQVSPIEIHEEDSPTNPKKNCRRPLGSKNNKKIQLQIMLSKNTMYLQKREQFLKQHTRAFCV